MTTPEIILAIFGTILSAGVGLIIFNLRVSTQERKEDRERLIRIETRLEGLDAMRSEIKSTANDVRVLDKIVASIDSRVKALEGAHGDMKDFCKSQHIKQ